MPSKPLRERIADEIQRTKGIFVTMTREDALHRADAILVLVASQGRPSQDVAALMPQPTEPSNV